MPQLFTERRSFLWFDSELHPSYRTSAFLTDGWNMCNITLRQNGTETRNPTYAVVFGSVIAVGLPLNAVALWILVRCHSLKSPSVVFMVNLVVSDLLLVISLPMRVYFYATGSWPSSNFACIFTTMLFRNNIRSSAFFITFICVDRLLAVVYPLRSRHVRTSSNAWRAAAFVWLLVLVMNIPESVIFSRFLNSYPEPSCFEFQCPQRSALHFIQPVLVLSMLTVNIVCTALVSLTLQRHLNDSARVNNKVNVMLIFVMNLIMFMVFFLPVTLGILIQSWRPFLTPLVCVASVNCCLDPLLYYFSFDGFWRRKEDVDSSLGRD
ncbi:lysophosphatidic acid receptor 6-like [Xyrichtys novacula]|uniref:Lysophosphatidic acid receptor 6-like n=1 Tax=Xyrichtys novacula TaxID=13765 RepID=A0AAV1FY61_XYRNO|nr:lysophosphatidic acid receptor 6-like [Xyrichtys novacula]